MQSVFCRIDWAIGPLTASSYGLSYRVVVALFIKLDNKSLLYLKCKQNIIENFFSFSTFESFQRLPLSNDSARAGEHF